MAKPEPDPLPKSPTFFWAKADESSFIGNANCDFSGEENEGKIQGNINLHVSCHSCQLQLYDNYSSSIRASNSLITMRNCSNCTVFGKLNSILATNNKNLNITEGSERNSLVVNENNHYRFSGSDSSQISFRNDFVEATGDKNQLALERNNRVFISGSENKINAFGNMNLRVTGSRNKVVAYQSDNITVLGNMGDVSLMDVNTAHHTLERFPEADEGIKQNIVMIGATWYTTVAPKPWSPAAHYHSHVVISKDCLIVDGKLVNPENYEDLGMEMIEKIDHFDINILYVDSVSIQKNAYRAGIFQFLLLQSATDVRNMIIHISIELLDKGSYKVELDGTESVVVSGSKGGICQMLRIIGKRVQPMEKVGGDQGSIFVSDEAVSISEPTNLFLLSVA